jgi:hypothetical protein
MVFSDYSLAKMVRARIRVIILTYVRDDHEFFGRDKIEKVIKAVYKSNNELMNYTIAGVFR